MWDDWMEKYDYILGGDNCYKYLTQYEMNKKIKAEWHEPPKQLSAEEQFENLKRKIARKPEAVIKKDIEININGSTIVSIFITLITIAGMIIAISVKGG